MWWDASVLCRQNLHHRHHNIQIIHLILDYAFYRLLRRLCLHCGLAITVVERLQRYNCIWLTYIVNVEQNIPFYIEVWSCEMLSLCGELIWRWNFVFQWCFVFRRTLYRRLCMNHFVLEELRDLFRCLVVPNSVRLASASWLFTFGWEPVCFENFWKCFDVFTTRWICRFVAAGIVSTNLSLKNLRFVNWKPGIEFTSWDIGSSDWCQKFILWTELQCHLA